tara:strand:- start:78397 stop:78807 length:411 start_codon:yes stop_codon:yes gene_type:complete
MKIFYNPKCSKCRAALGLLKEKFVEYEIVEYLKTCLSEDLVSKFYDTLGSEILRVKDLDNPIEMTKENIVNAIVRNPKLLQRPILVDGEKIIIGREEEKVKDFIKEHNKNLLKVVDEEIKKISFTKEEAIKDDLYD